MTSPATIDDPAVDARREVLLGVMRTYGRVAVAFSGGVDSAVVAKAAVLAVGAGAVAVTADSPSLSSGELQQAQHVAEIIGIPHRIIRTEEFASAGYRANAGDRCYYCKQELYGQLVRMKSLLGVDVIANGANLDDRGDYRPGMRAAAEQDVRSPLIEAAFRKSDVRDLARQWNLPVWDKPATPCLSSRIAHGIEVTPERVRRVDAAEAFLKREFDLRELRVRLEAGELARIEVSPDDIPRLSVPDAARRIAAHLRELGFRCVTLDLEGFRSGSLNDVLPLEQLTRR
jgi:uncharacterized protein